MQVRVQPSTEARPASAVLAEARALMESDPAGALIRLQALLAVDATIAEAHRLRAAALRRLNRPAEAAAAEAAAIRASVHDPELQRAAQALLANQLQVAEPILKGRLKANPFDVAAIRMLAELAARIGRTQDAENLLRRALELAPGFHAARQNLATVLHRKNQTAEALEHLDMLLAAEPDHAGHANLKAAALGRVGDFEEALALYEDVLRKSPNHPLIWMSYGHTLKTVGRQDDSIAAYRSAIAIKPELGEVWWSLANLKTISFDADDRAAMAAALDKPGITQSDRLHLHFALGKAHEDAGDVATAFHHYAEGNRQRHEELGYDPEDTAEQVDRTIATYTPAFLAARAGQGFEAPDPIFILGLPRAGSTLIEQILSSHSQVEGTMELPDIPALAARVATQGGVEELDGNALRALGAEFIERTRIQRKTDKPFFIDKLPNNWAQVGFIHLILPNAKIIDARRHPMDCCFSNFRQHFARGQSFSYSLEGIGRYYGDYARQMRHFDAVLPGRVHRVIHEDLLDDPEGEVARLLAYLGLAFEDECLRFWESGRAVRTASSEQVRRPINRDGVDRWQPYEAWLDPLKTALAPVLDDYRG